MPGADREEVVRTKRHSLQLAGPVEDIGSHWLHDQLCGGSALAPSPVQDAWVGRGGWYWQHILFSFVLELTVDEKSYTDHEAVIGNADGSHRGDL